MLSDFSFLFGSARVFTVTEWKFLYSAQPRSEAIQICFNFHAILHGSRDTSRCIYLFLTVYDNIVMTCLEKTRLVNFEMF